MACALVDTGTGSSSGSTGGNFSMSITAGVRAIVQIATDGTDGSTISCDIGGQAGVQVSSSEAVSTFAGVRVLSFKVDSPPSGTQTVTWAKTGGNAFMNCNVVTASGSASVGNGNNAIEEAGDGIIALAMTSANGDLSVTTAYFNGAGTPTTSQTGIGSNGTTANDRKTTVSDVNPTHTWTASGTTGVITGANFVAAGGDVTTGLSGSASTSAAGTQAPVISVAL